MTQSVLKALMRLFSFVAYVYQSDDIQGQKKVVELFLKLYVRDNEVLQYNMMFDFYLKSLKQKESEISPKKISVYSVKSLLICDEVNKKLTKDQKSIILLYLVEVAFQNEENSKKSKEFLRTISDALKIINSDFENTMLFVLNKYEDILNNKKILLISNNPVPNIKRQITEENLIGKIIVLQYKASNIYVFRHIDNDDMLYLNNRKIEINRSYIFEKGASIHNPKISSLYYSDIVKTFLTNKALDDFSISAQNIEFYFNNSSNGIQNMNFCAKSGQMVGIMGGSGVGKSTFLNVLNGSLKVSSGEILINGYNLAEEKDKLKGLIGFIPQDDLLIEELTVYQNLYYNAHLCFKDLSEEDIVIKVNKTLKDLDLYEIKHLSVGSPLRKFISGGQRKRLNIALELIREPYILLVDEPTSGLSSHDSENVMDLFKTQALNGKIVIINIHQPSSKIFKLFDKLLVFDTGGRTVYYGNPVESVVYFKNQSMLVNSNESECLTCGNVNPEQVLEIVEMKTVNENGRYTEDRVVDAQKWYSLYKKNIEVNIDLPKTKVDLPGNNFKVPGKLKQFKIFSLRNIITKLSDKQYLLINFIESPLLAIILGFFTKHIVGSTDTHLKYVFGENENFPAYLFMSVIVAIFLGMMVSAEEIIKDRKLLKRESFLNLSWNSYLNSKIIVLFAISAIQTLLFVIIGNVMVGVKGMNFSFWIILFSASCFSNVLGLNISASLKSIVSIYITIPLLLVPQLLFAGVIVKFDKLNNSVTSQDVVPFIGDIMVSRWAYEALAVDQFKNNSYQQIFYEIEQKESEAAFNMNYRVPELSTKTYLCQKLHDDMNRRSYVAKELGILRDEIGVLQKKFKNIEFNYYGSLNVSSFNNEVAQNTLNYLKKIKRQYSRVLEEKIYEKDKLIVKIINEKGNKNAFFEFKDSYYNKSLANQVLNKIEKNKLIESNSMLIQKAEPIFKYPTKNNGRAHFYAPYKRIFGLNIETIFFNVFVIWLMTATFYVALQFKLIKKLLSLTSAIKKLKNKV